MAVVVGAAGKGVVEGREGEWRGSGGVGRHSWGWRREIIEGRIEREVSIIRGRGPD